MESTFLQIYSALQQRLICMYVCMSFINTYQTYKSILHISKCTKTHIHCIIVTVYSDMCVCADVSRRAPVTSRTRVAAARSRLSVVMATS